MTMWSSQNCNKTFYCFKCFNRSWRIPEKSLRNRTPGKGCSENSTIKQNYFRYARLVTDLMLTSCWTLSAYIPLEQGN